MDKIVFVIGSTKNGGAEKRAIYISKLLQDKYETRVFAFHGEKTKDIDFVYRESYKDYKSKKRRERIEDLANYISKEKPDLVFSFVPHINYFTSKALKKSSFTKAKHIVGIVNVKNSFKSTILLKKSIKTADAVYYQCEEQKEYIKCKCYAFSLPNPIKPIDYVSKESKFKMMSVGRLEKQKDFSFMINAFKKIHAVYPQAVLDIYGNGSQKENLEKLIEKLDLCGVVRINEYTDLIDHKFNDHDIFLFTSKFEGFPNALMEAMNNSLICFATHFKTGLVDLIANKDTGFISTKKTVRDFSNLVISELKHYDNARNVAKNGNNHVNKMCNPKTFEEELTKHICIILKSN